MPVSSVAAAPRLASSSGGAPTLRAGSRGASVSELQQLLNRSGQHLAADGSFGPKTAAAVKQFQAAHGLAPDGVVGPKTWAALRSAAKPASSPVLRQGASGESVKQMQGLLSSKGYGVAADGAFGPKTAAAVKRFQSASGLAADGVVGPKTWAALRSAAKPAGSMPVLRRGAKGSSVTQLQQLLARKGYGVAADGVFGPNTQAAVKRFQSASGLAADGVVGPRTWAALGATGPVGDVRTVEGWANGRRTTIQVSPVSNGQFMNVRCAQRYLDMLAAARRAGINLGTTYGYRSYAEQQRLYKELGPKVANYPGYSNHQMGLSADISGIAGYNSRAYRWLKENAGAYGFVNDASNEPWHWTFRG